MTDARRASWPPGRAIGRGPHEHSGAAAGRVAALRVGVHPERRAEEVRHREVGHQDVFPEALHLEPRKEREQVDPPLLEHRDRLPKARSGRSARRRRRKEEAPPSRAGAPWKRACGLPSQPSRRLHARDDREPWVLRREPREDRGRRRRSSGRSRRRPRSRDSPARGATARRPRSPRLRRARERRPITCGRGEAAPGGAVPMRRIVRRLIRRRTKTDRGQRGGRDEGAVNEGYDSGTFCRASAR